MKIAVLADIHANYRALEAVIDHIERWGPDHVFVAGDIVNRGPRSLCCLEWIEEKRQNESWRVIRGNHEDYVLQRERPDAPQSGPKFEMFKPVHFSHQQLNGHTGLLRSLPEKINLDFGAAGEVRMLHGSMLGNRDGIYPENTDAEIERKITPAPAVFITAHTHRPLVARVNGTLVVNAGSAGLPFDGDTRPAYAQITYQNNRWQAEIIRLNYDLQAAEQDFQDFGFISGGGPLVELILIELQTGMGQLYQWVAKYNKPIKNGEITVEAATREFLQNPITEPYW
jgi:predicted phosphodiesterase